MTAPLTHDCLSQSSAIPDGVHCPARKEENISKYKVYLNQEGIHKLCVNERKISECLESFQLIFAHIAQNNIVGK